MEADVVTIAFLFFSIGLLTGVLLTAWYLNSHRRKSRFRWQDEDDRYPYFRDERVRPIRMDSTNDREGRRSWWSFFRKNRNEWDTRGYRGTSYHIEKDWHAISKAERRAFDFSHKPSFTDRLLSLFRKNNRW